MDKNQIYMDLRNAALQIKPEEVGVYLENDYQVYAVLVDFKGLKHEASLFCAYDGTVSLYYGNGGASLGLGRVESIKKAAMTLLISSGQTIPNLPTFEDELSYDKEHIHLIATKVHKVGVNVTGNPKVIQFLDFLVQNVITEIRKNDE